MLVDFGLMYMMCNAIAPSNSESIPYWSEHIQKVQNLFFYITIFEINFWRNSELVNVRES